MLLPADNLTTFDADRLMVDLVNRHLLESSRAAAVMDDFHRKHPSSDPVVLAEHLVQVRLLTPFQAERALAGALHSLCLGPYRLLEPIGGGNCGVVYKAVSRTDQQEYAVRVLPPPGPWQMRGVKAVWATVAALPAHPTVVPLTDVESGDGTEYLVWPFVNGESLEHSVQRVGPLTPADAARLFAELAEGLADCHDRGITHGWVRPSSILVGFDRRPRLTDLGLGTLLVENSVAPNDATNLDLSSDVYAFGCSLYFALTSVELPGRGEVIRGGSTTLPPPVRSRNPAVPEALASVVDAVLREQPVDLRRVGAELRSTVPQSIFAPPADRVKPDAEIVGQDTPSESPSWAITIPDAVTSSRDAKRPGWYDDAGSINFDLPSETPAVTEDWNARNDPSVLPLSKADPGPPSVPPPEAAVPIPLRAAPRPVSPPPPTIPPKLAEGTDSKRRAMPTPIDVRSKSQQSAVIQTRPRVAVPEPPLFARNSVRKARSLMFWKGSSDAVLISVFGPPAVSPGQRVQLLVYANLPDAFDGVATLCRALHSEADLLGVGYIDRPVPHQTKVGLHLAVANAGVAKSLTEFTWSGQTQPRTFELFVPWESPSGLTTGMMTAGINNERVGTIPFYFVVLPRSG